MRWVMMLAVLAWTGCDSSSNTSSNTSSNAAPSSVPSGAHSGAGAATESAELKAGSPAPDVEFTVVAGTKSEDGQKVKLSSLRGEKVLIWFYPKDDTPGCKMEGMGLRDHFDELTAAGVKVFGVSLQDADSHKAFIDKYGFPFPLVVDDGTLAQAFGVPVKGEYAARQSFLVGEDGKLIEVWREVKPAEHAEQVVAAAKRK